MHERVSHTVRPRVDGRWWIKNVANDVELRTPLGAHRTQPADERSLAGVLSHVSVSRTHVQEPIAAEDAHVRQLAVRFLVRRERSLLQTIWIDRNISRMTR